MSGLEVIGGIAAVISIIDASIKIYDSTQKDIKLSETFNTVRRRLPILLNTLEACKNYLEPIRDTMPQDVCQALEKILKACDEKARKLKEIFEKIIPNEKDTWEKRYFKVVQRFGKGNKVEDLMIAVTKDVQLIVNHHIVNSATPGQKAELEEIIKEMKSLPSSIPEDENLDMSFSAGRDMNAYVHRGPGDHHFASKGGRIYSASTQNFFTESDPLTASTRMPGAKFIPVGEIDTGAFKAPRTVYKFSDDTARLKRLYGPFYDLMIDWKKDVIKIPKLHTLLQGPVELPDRVNVLNGEEQNHPIPRVLDYSRACWLNLLIELGSIHSEWRSQRERERGYQFSFTRSGIMKDAYRVPNYKDWITTTLVPSLGNAGNDVVATSRIVAFPFTNRDVAALCDIFGAGVAGRYADGSYRARLGDATLFIRTNSNGITMAHFEGKLHATPEQWRRYRLQVLGTDISPLHVFRTNTVGKPQKWYGVIKMVEQIELVLRETTSAVANGTFNPHLPSALVSLKADIRAILEAVGLALIVYPNEVYKAETREVMLKISEGTEGLSFREGVREMSRRIIMGPKSKMDERINTFLDALGTDWEAMQAALSRSSSNDLLHLFNVFDLSTYGRRYTLICDLTLELLLSISGWSTFPAMNLSRDRQVFDMCNFGEQIFFA